MVSILSAGERAAAAGPRLHWLLSCSQLENNKGRSRQGGGGGGKKKRGKRSCGLLALPGSNHSREKESRPLSRQPLREPVGGNTGAAQAVLFIKTHTHIHTHTYTHTHTTQLVSLAASFLLIWLCRSQMQSEQKGEQLL